MTIPDKAQNILTFWFQELTPEQWFLKNDQLDADIRIRFGDDVMRALGGQYDGWAGNAVSRLSLILLLDQFTRNIYRNTPQAFAGDEMACALALRSVDDGTIAAENEQSKRHFYLMPMMHSEELAIQDASLPLFVQFTNAKTAEYAKRHRDIIAQFGHFPHRNDILGRPSTEEEKVFLSQPGSSF